MTMKNKGDGLLRLSNPEALSFQHDFCDSRLDSHRVPGGNMGYDPG